MSHSVNRPYAVRCRCGREKSDRSVRPIRRYGFWGVICLLMGYTPLPTQIEISCETCGTIFDSITNRTMLERYRYDEPGASDK